MRVKKVRGLISVTLVVDDQEQDYLYNLSEEELVKLSRGHVQGILSAALVREVAVGYDGGESIEVVMSL